MMLKELLSAIRGKKLILFGEIHGTREIPELVTKVLPNLAINTLFLEIPVDQQPFIDAFLAAGTKESLATIPFYASPALDGRGSKEYLEVIRKVFLLNQKMTHKTRIVCVDVPAEQKKSSEQRDTFMCQQILKNLEKQCLFIAGNIHTSLKPVSAGGKRVLTTGTLLKQYFPKEIVSIALVPLSGKFYNFGVQSISTKELQTRYNLTAKEQGNTFIQSNREKTGYDYMYTIKHVSPATFLAKEN